MYDTRLSRRRLLRLGAGGLAGATLAPLLAGCGEESTTATTAAAGDTGAAAGSSTAAASTPAELGDIKMWWWGEQEAVGIQAWVDETIKKFKEERGGSVEATLMDTDQVIPQFTNAAASGNVPDVQFLFNGIYHMENAWLGYLSPLDGLVAPETIERGGATSLSTYEGKTYRTGFYSVGFGVAYNKELFDKAGLDGDAPPTDWDGFIDACTKLKASGVIPFSGGVKDGYLGEWYFVNGLTQNLDSPADALNLFTGNLSWEDPRYHEHWVRLEELKKGGFINDDINSLELYQGIQLFDTGKSAMCINTTPAIPNSQKQLGDKLGFMVMPTFGKGKLAGIPITDTQGFGIPSKAEDQKTAAAFLDYMHTPERVQAMWTVAKQIPADTGFDASVIDDPLLKSIHERWVAGEHNVYIADLMPTLFWTDAMFAASQKILAGEMTGEESGKLAAEVTEKWKKQNPDKVENYTTWGKDLSAA